MKYLPAITNIFLRLLSPQNEDAVVSPSFGAVSVPLTWNASKKVFRDIKTTLEEFWSIASEERFHPCTAPPTHTLVANTFSLNFTGEATTASSFTLIVAISSLEMSTPWILTPVATVTAPDFTVARTTRPLRLCGEVVINQPASYAAAGTVSRLSGTQSYHSGLG